MNRVGPSRFSHETGWTGEANFISLLWLSLPAPLSWNNHMKKILSTPVLHPVSRVLFLISKNVDFWELLDPRYLMLPSNYFCAPDAGLKIHGWLEARCRIKRSEEILGKLNMHIRVHWLLQLLTFLMANYSSGRRIKLLSCLDSDS